MRRQIPLTKGAVTWVDEEDFARFGALRWHLHSDGYAARTECGPDGKKRQILLHRVIAGNPTGRDVHHKDEDRLNNTRENLVPRIHGDHQSQHVRNRPQFNGRFKGVYFNRKANKWAAQIWDGGRNRYLGSHSSEEEAAVAYNKAAAEVFGSGCYLNMVKRPESPPLPDAPRTD